MSHDIFNRYHLKQSITATSKKPSSWLTALSPLKVGLLSVFARRRWLYAEYPWISEMGLFLFFLNRWCLVRYKQGWNCRREDFILQVTMSRKSFSTSPTPWRVTTRQYLSLWKAADPSVRPVVHLSKSRPGKNPAPQSQPQPSTSKERVGQKISGKAPDDLDGWKEVVRMGTKTATHPPQQEKPK